jgi:hypothetical protein
MGMIISLARAQAANHRSDWLGPWRGRAVSQGSAAAWRSSKGVSLGGSTGDSVGTDGVGGDNTEAVGGEVSHGVGLVVDSFIVAG